MSEGGKVNDQASDKSIDAKKREILGRLRFNEAEFLSRLERTVDHAQKYIGIEPHSGRVVLTDLAKSLKVPLQIRLLLAGRYFSRELGDLPNDKMGYKELAAELNRPASGVSTELTDLVRDGDLVRDQDGLVFMPFHRVETTLVDADSAVSDETASSSDAGVATPAAPRAASARRNGARKADSELSEMLLSGKDTSAFAWVKDLEPALDRGLAGLLVARELYGKPKMTAKRLEGLLNSVFRIGASRAAINMAFLKVRGNYVLATPVGREIEYTLLVPGEKYLEAVRNKPRHGTLDSIPESDGPASTA